MRLKERYDKVLAALEEFMPSVDTELNYSDPFQLLVSVILSAQCTDKRVNIVTPALFSRFPDAATMAKASEEEIFHYIKSISYPNAKSRNLKKMAERLSEVYGGKVPERREDLESLAGVGRKTANVIGAVLFGKAVMPVDTHVHRVSRRIGLTRNAKTPLQTEEQLMAQLEGREGLADVHHRLILLGRYTCKARLPECSRCPVSAYCKFHAAKQREK